MPVAGVGFGILHVNPPEGICRERNATRRDSVDSAKGEYVPQEVFERMVSMFESPDPNRASWETNTYVLKDSIQKQPDFLQTIHAAFDDLTTKAALALETQREERTRIQCLQEQQVRHLTRLWILFVDVDRRPVLNSTKTEPESYPILCISSILSFESGSQPS